MSHIGIVERFLAAGTAGIAMLLYAAYVQSAAMQNVRLDDVSPLGLLIKLGAVMSMAGLLAFFHTLPTSWRNTHRNIFRAIYAAAFGLATYCSAGDWQCFG